VTNLFSSRIGERFTRSSRRFTASREKTGHLWQNFYCISWSQELHS